MQTSRTLSTISTGRTLSTSGASQTLQTLRTHSAHRTSSTLRTGRTGDTSRTLSTSRTSRSNQTLKILRTKWPMRPINTEVDLLITLLTTAGAQIDRMASVLNTEPGIDPGNTPRLNRNSRLDARSRDQDCRHRRNSSSLTSRAPQRALTTIRHNDSLKQKVGNQVKTSDHRAVTDTVNNPSNGGQRSVSEDPPQSNALIDVRTAQRSYQSVSECARPTARATAQEYGWPGSGST